MTVAEQILDALGDVGMDLVDMSEKQRFPGSFLRRTLPVAACAALMLTGGLLAHRYLTVAPAAPQAQPAAEQSASENMTLYTAAKQEPVQLSSQSSACAEGAARQTNLELACEAINGFVLEPGESFSFNTVVGERTEEKGYQIASAYADDETSGEVGGGIGQVASMLYCAALKLDLEQLERAGNTYPVTYVPMGFDAAVYWGVTDYCFRNSLDTPLEIRASVTDGEISVALWGSPEAAQTIELSSNLIAENVVETYQRFLDGQGNLLRQESIGITRYEERK